MKVAKLAIVLCLIGVFVVQGRSDGLLQNAGNQQFLRLSTTQVEVQVYDQIAITTVVHEFINLEDVDSLDVTYMFPLPANAAVTGLAVWRDSLYVDFQLTAPDSGGGNQDLPGGGDSNPALLDYLRPNPLIVPMVATSDTVRVRLSYAELLSFDFGAIQYRYPLPGGQFSTGALDAFAMLATFSTQRSIVTIQTPDFPAGIDMPGAFSATVGYDAAAFNPSTDFVIDYQLSQEDVGLFTLTYNNPADTTEDAGFFVALLEPGNVQPGDILNKHFTFVLDRSGSMSVGKIDQAKAAARYCIEHLNENDFFSIIDFSSSTSQFRSEAVRATRENIDEAVQYIDGIQAGGGTNINEALLLGLRQTAADQVNQIIFLTDGMATAGVTSTEAILNNVRRDNVNDASIFVFGLGNGVAKDLLQALADNNHGIATYIAEGEPVDNVIVNFFARVNNPVLVNVSLDFGELEVFDIYPTELPDMFAGFQLLVTGRYRGAVLTDITLNGSVANSDTALVYANIAFPDSSTENVFLPKIWAKKKIDFLYARWLKEGEPEALKEEIIALSLKYGVLSPFTEFDEPDPPVTAVDGVFFTSTNATFDATEDRIALAWIFSGLPEEVVQVEIYRASGMDFERVAVLQPGVSEFLDVEAEPAQAQRYRIVLLLVDGATVEAEVRYEPQLIAEFALAQNYPNPFNPTTQITFVVGKSGPARLIVYNLLGEMIAELVSQPLQAGRHTFTWDGHDDQGRSVASGIYFYRLEAADFSQTRRMLLMR